MEFYFYIGEEVTSQHKRYSFINHYTRFIYSHFNYLMVESSINLEFGNINIRLVDQVEWEGIWVRFGKSILLRQYIDLQSFFKLQTYNERLEMIISLFEQAISKIFQNLVLKNPELMDKYNQLKPLLKKLRDVKEYYEKELVKIPNRLSTERLLGSLVEKIYVHFIEIVFRCFTEQNGKFEILIIRVLPHQRFFDRLVANCKWIEKDRLEISNNSKEIIIAVDITKKNHEFIYRPQKFSISSLKAQVEFLNFDRSESKKELIALGLFENAAS